MGQLKLIACDLDGTLLLNGAQQLQPETCELIRELGSRGILFCAASGRQYSNLRRLFEPVSDEIAYLCENGCLGFYQGSRIFRETMERSLGQELMQTILETEGAEVLLSGEKVCYVQPKNMEYFYHMRDTVRNDTVIVPDILRTDEAYMKVSLYEKGGLRNVRCWQDRFGDRCTVVTGGGEWLDMMPKGVNKGTGLIKILRTLGIDQKDCMAVGDNDNDLEMLEAVGYPAAVRSGKPAVRRIALFETDTVENLFRRILENEIVL